MTTWVALLRGINVGRNKRVAMADLRALLESLGYDDVRTHLQSGNAIFSTGSAKPADLERKISAQLKADLGLDVSVLVRTAAQLSAIAKANPFVSRKVDPNELGVTFLSAAPPAKKIAALDPDAFAPDEFAAGEGVIYTRQPKGVLASRLPDWGRALGVTVTARSWNTFSRLLELAKD